MTDAPKAQTEAVTGTSHLAVGNELGKRCQLHFENVIEAPKFSYDQFSLSPEDRQVLDQVATCITRGPLAGRRLKLVGRTDPRGTEEYNLGLGDRRAEMVDDYLKRSGVAPIQVSSTTRGELDARGQDEAGWQLDRRVDLELD